MKTYFFLLLAAVIVSLTAAKKGIKHRIGKPCSDDDECGRRMCCLISKGDDTGKCQRLSRNKDKCYVDDSLSGSDTHHDYCPCTKRFRCKGKEEIDEDHGELGTCEPTLKANGRERGKGQGNGHGKGNGRQRGLENGKGRGRGRGRGNGVANSSSDPDGNMGSNHGRSVASNNRNSNAGNNGMSMGGNNGNGMGSNNGNGMGNNNRERGRGQKNGHGNN